MDSCLISSVQLVPLFSQKEVFAFLPCCFFGGSGAGKISAAFRAVGVLDFLLAVVLSDMAVFLTGKQERGCHGNHTSSLLC